LLTRDRHFLPFLKKGAPIVFLNGNTVEDCAKELGRLIKVDWLLKPFSRCLLCNSIFEVAKPSVMTDVPEYVREREEEFWYCRSCEKVFWQGSHTHKIREKLESWQSDGENL